MRFVVVQASETVGTEDRTIEAAQHMETACKLMVRVKQYDRAADALHQTLQLYSERGAGAAAGRVVLAFILVQVLTDVQCTLYIPVVNATCTYMCSITFKI